MAEESGEKYSDVIIDSCFNMLKIDSYFYSKLK